MALSTLQEQYALELLDIPPNSIVFKIDQLGLNATQILGNGATAAVAAFHAQFIALTTDQQTVVTNILNDYVAIVDVTPGFIINNGSVSANVSGVTFDPKAAIARIRQRLLHYLPFWDTWETRETRAAQTETMRAAVLM